MDRTAGLAEHSTPLMEEPGLPGLLRDFLGKLRTEEAERVAIVAEFGMKAEAS